MITYITINMSEIALVDVSTLSSYEGPYTHEEILVIMATPEWTDPNPPE